MRLSVEFTRFRQFAARSIGAPCGQNDGIICLREHETCVGVAALDNALEYDPRCSDIALTEQPLGARDQSCCLCLVLRVGGHRLSRCGLHRSGDRTIQRAPEGFALVHRAPRGDKIACHCSGLIALLLCRRLLLSHGRIVRRFRLRRLILHFTTCFSKLVRECCGPRLRLVERTALLLGTCRHRLSRSANLLNEGGNLSLLLLQRVSQLGSGRLRGQLLLQGLVNSLSRLRGLDLDLAARSSELTRKCRGTRLCLVKRAALLSGGCRGPLARSVDLLG